MAVKRRPTEEPGIDIEAMKRKHPDMKFLTKEEALDRLRAKKPGQADRSARAKRAAATRASNRVAAGIPDRVKTCVTLTAEDQVYLRWLGKNNVARGIRIAARLARQQFREAPDEGVDLDERIAELRGELQRKRLPR